jgi:hypothetical protein
MEHASSSEPGRFGGPINLSMELDGLACAIAAQLPAVGIKLSETTWIKVPQAGVCGRDEKASPLIVGKPKADVASCRMHIPTFKET